MAIIHWTESLCWGGILLCEHLRASESRSLCISPDWILQPWVIYLFIASSSTILFIKLLHSSLGASVRIIIPKTDLIPPRASTKKQPPSVRDIQNIASMLLLHLIYVIATSELCP